MKCVAFTRADLSDAVADYYDVLKADCYFDGALKCLTGFVENSSEADIADFIETDNSVIIDAVLDTFPLPHSPTHEWILEETVQDIKTRLSFSKSEEHKDSSDLLYYEFV